MSTGVLQLGGADTSNVTRITQGLAKGPARGAEEIVAEFQILGRTLAWLFRI